MNPEFVALGLRLEASYLAATSSELVPMGGSDEARAIWLYQSAPFGLLAHDDSDEPRFVYANLTAQRCFEYGWNELIGMASHRSAGPEHQADRERLLDDVRRHGWASGYRGLRVSRSGQRFWIEDVEMWTVPDQDGRPWGQGALFRGTTPFNGT